MKFMQCYRLVYYLLDKQLHWAECLNDLKNQTAWSQGVRQLGHVVFKIY